MKWWVLMARTVLGVMVISTALGVVYLRHESRSLFVQRQRLQAEQDEYQVEWSLLQVEQAWLGDTSRIEQFAREELRMVPPQQAELILIDP